MSCERGTNRNRNGLSRRLTRTYALLFSISMLLLSVCVYFVSYEFIVLRQNSVMMKNAELIELNTNSELTLLISDESETFINMSSNFLLDADEVPGCMNKTVLYSQSDGTMLLCHAEGLENETGHFGILTLVLRITREYEFLNMLAWLLIGVNIAGIAGALLVGRIMTNRMLHPIGSMIEKARGIDSRKLDERLDVPEADDELRRLALTLNAMLARVEDAFRRQGQFTQDASHELRTPLSVLQGNADLLARWGMNDPAVAERCIATIRRQTEYMHRLVEELLFLARGDGEWQALTRTAINLNNLFDETLDERRCIDPAHVYSSDIQGNPTLNADAIF